MTKSKFMKGLLGASALTLLSTGTAFAQTAPAANNFTQAGTDVSNTFSLDYNVGTVPQPPITNVAGDETVFRVDRLVNVTVAAVTSGATFTPNQEDVFVEFTVRNDGNDTHPYFLGVEEVTGDDFNADPSTSTDNIVYFRDTNDDGVVSGTELDTPIPFVPATGGSYPDIAPDEVILVRVVRDIPEDAEDGQTSDIHLFADTRITGDELNVVGVVADEDSANSTLDTENVLVDENGPAADATNDGATDGAHSATNTFVVLAADLTATKEVFAVSETDCTAIPGTYTPPTDNAGNYFIPNACVEYVITVQNDGDAPAIAIDLLDNLPEGLIFRSAELRGQLLGGALSVPSAATECSLTGSPVGGPNCPVNLTAGTIEGNAVGYLVIRANVK